MAKSNKQNESSWLESMCSKHTPNDTSNWVAESWSKIIQAEFLKFKKAIADQTSDIPDSFFVTKEVSHGNSNPLFAFLRPQKLLYIALAINSNRTKVKQRNSLKQILTEYRAEWGTTLHELQARLISNTAVSKCRHLIERLAEQTYCLEGAEHINPNWYEKYRDLYFQACEAFSDIPCQLASDKQAAKTLREQIKIAIGKAPKEKQHRKPRVSSEVRGKRNLVVQHIINIQSDAQKKGLPKVSVDNAILDIKRNPAWRQRLASLGLKNNTIKALVRDAWAKIRQDGASS